MIEGYRCCHGNNTWSPCMYLYFFSVYLKKNSIPEDYKNMYTLSAKLYMVYTMFHNRLNYKMLSLLNKQKQPLTFSNDTYDKFIIRNTSGIVLVYRNGKIRLCIVMSCVIPYNMWNFSYSVNVYSYLKKETKKW